MTAFKRNQLEAAIAGVLEPRSAEPSSELRTRIKKLLETDRALGREPRASREERRRFAFFTSEGPGSGVEVWFSPYEVFAVLTALRVMAHGWSHSFAVSVMRRIRADLEEQHGRIMREDPKRLFDQAEIRRNAKEGAMAFDNTDPVLLTIVPRAGTVQNDEAEPFACAVCRGADKAWAFCTKVAGGRGAATTMFEVATIAHRVADKLLQTQPSRRGPG
jgi:hypothetical protein